MSTAASTRTQWMFEGKVGLSTHYFPSKTEDVEQVTDAFSVEKVAEQASEAGAKWFMLTVHHQPWLMMAPNETYDKLLGHGKYTARRDLPLDLHKALHAKGIRMMLYVNLRLDDKSGCMEVDPKIQKSMGGWPPNDKLVDNIAAVYREWSLRYGDKVSGWWVDGAWMKLYKNSRHREKYFKKIADALRAGNPDAIVAFNPGEPEQVRLDRYSPQNDYLAGESNGIADPPRDGRLLGGAQWHWWSFAGNGWGAGGTRYTDEQLIEFATKVVEGGGAMTFDVGTLGVIKQARTGPVKRTENVGHIEPAQIKQIRAITDAIKDVKYKNAQ